jgi:hypothetical protein
LTATSRSWRADIVQAKIVNPETGAFIVAGNVVDLATQRSRDSLTTKLSQV